MSMGMREILRKRKARKIFRKEQKETMKQFEKEKPIRELLKKHGKKLKKTYREWYPRPMNPEIEPNFGPYNEKIAELVKQHNAEIEAFKKDKKHGLSEEEIDKAVISFWNSWYEREWTDIRFSASDFLKRYKKKHK